jgi:hypothetical protein
MWQLSWRGGSPNKPCGEYEKLQQVAEDLLANFDDSTSPEQFAEAQKGLLFYWEELKKHLDPLHPRFPGGHLCLDQCYLHYAMLIRNKYILQKPRQPEAPPAPQQPPLTPDQVVNNLRKVAKELKRPRDTYLGNDAPPPKGNTA